MMQQTGLIPNAHSDLVTDASYDFYGLRLATCSLDQRIKVWQLDESTNEWTVEDDWRAHDAAVSKLSWAHPEFGAIIASSSFDRTVKVWEQASPISASDSEQSGLNARWIERSVLLDAKGTVRAVEFAPHHFGLKLATISSDNCLRIYECLEQPSLATWQLSEEVDVPSLPSNVSPVSLSRTQTMALATPTQTNATLEGASASLVAQALQQGLQQGSTSTPARPGIGNREADGGWCISWCKDRYWGEVIATSVGISGVVKIVQLSPSRRPAAILTLDPNPPPNVPAAAVPFSGPTAPSAPTTEIQTSAITSVAWAPSCGRSYHLIATGGRDGRVRIWKVKPGDEGELGLEEGRDVEKEEGIWTASIVADFDQHKSAIGRVEWNITGTILSSAGNDGRIRLWKATAGSVWRPAGSIGVEQVEKTVVAQQPDPKDVEMEP